MKATHCQPRHIQTLNADFDIKNRTIFAAMLGLKVELALFDGLLNVGRDIFLRLVDLDIGNAHGQQFLAAVATHLAIGVIDLQ